jgi:UPF0755 protein
VTLDELELAFDDQDRGRHRHRRSKRKNKRRDGRRGRSLFALLLSLVIIAALVGGAWYGFQKVQGFFVAADYTTGGEGDVTVLIPDGATATDIAQTLYDKGVVKSPKAFIEAANADSRSRNLQPGTYKLRLKMRAKDALQLLLDRSSRLVNGVTIPEGTTAKEAFAILAKATGLPVTDFETAAKDPAALGVPASWLSRTDGKQSILGAEGFLFPATYELQPGATAVQILHAMVAKFLVVAQKAGIEQGAHALGISPFEALIIASLVQAEAGINTDMPMIARVVYNRQARKPPIPLQFDATTNYWLTQQGQQRKPSQHLTQSELNDPKNPYNTTLAAGLPPGPIGNPGEPALQAAINPTPGTWLFFVVIDKTGKSAFATTQAEHDRNIALARKNGVL